MQDPDFSQPEHEGPFSPHELRLALGTAVLWVAATWLGVQLLLLPVQVV